RYRVCLVGLGKFCSPEFKKTLISGLESGQLFDLYIDLEREDKVFKNIVLEELKKFSFVDLLANAAREDSYALSYAIRFLEGNLKTEGFKHYEKQDVLKLFKEVGPDVNISELIRFFIKDGFVFDEEFLRVILFEREISKSN